ncbi:CLUMA_CG008774, isoform A [Clunio marinus]|uniref:CLUMA_CG008774, isoform A n=1 Tax=Clunio marinus TaxID=568069 RepID=A0A1J1I4U6_9DIPT|nr:CLUMA_CG008774, isoform A [Clunio marinus]
MESVKPLSCLLDAYSASQEQQLYENLRQKIIKKKKQRQFHLKMFFIHTTTRKRCERTSCKRTLHYIHPSIQPIAEWYCVTKELKCEHPTFEWM